MNKVVWRDNQRVEMGLPCDKRVMGRGEEQWQSPNEGFLKFNIDRSTRGNLGIVKLGGMSRDKGGIMLALFSRPIGVCESNYAELMVVKVVLDVFYQLEWLGRKL